MGLSGNELLCYSLVFGFTQDKETEFRGSLSYIASALNVTRQNAKRILDRLVEKGCIEKRELMLSGVKLCHYIANSNPVAETATGCYQNDNGVLSKQQRGVIKTATHNTIIDKDIDIDKDNTHTSRVRARRTSEESCLFADSRFADYEKFAAEFSGPDYEDIDISYYYNSVADWSSRSGKKQKDWIATARSFMRRDNARGELKKKASMFKGLSQDAIDYLKSMQ